MGESTGIAWTDHTFNPWWGCARVSAGCEHCYAEAWAKRTGLSVWGQKSERRFFGEKHWKEPLKWNKAAALAGVRRRVFCSSMADVFEDRPDLVEPRERLFTLIVDTPYLDWQLLTKRPENLRAMLPWTSPQNSVNRPPWSNVWLGTTCEDQKRADERIPILCEVPAEIRFASYEPAIEYVRFAPVSGLDWIIVGGESGPKARPFDLSWARRTVEHCDNYGIACFVKQMGDDPVDGSAGCEVHFSAHHGADPAEWPEELRVQRFPGKT